MSKPKLLRNTRTGVLFTYTDKLAQNRDMEPCDGKGTPFFETVTDESDETNETGSGPESSTTETSSAVTDEGIIVSQATKPQLLEFAKKHYNQALNTRDSVDELRKQVQALIDGDQ